MLPVVEAHARYKGEVKYDDWISVRIWVSDTKRASLRFDYEVQNETTGKITTEGHTWHVVMSAELRKAVSIPAWLHELLNRDPV
jgi:acyl-CoA thioester hydrolase